MPEMLIGIVIGIICSLVAWWITFHAVVPRVAFEEKIGKRNDECSDGRAVYRIRFSNIGRRKIVDVSLFARMYVQGLDGRDTWRKRVIMVPLGIAHWPMLDVGSGTYGTILLPEKTKQLAETWYPEKVRQKALSEQIDLEDIFALGSNAVLQMVAFAYDEFSGARKVVFSKQYTIEDIKKEID